MNVQKTSPAWIAANPLENLIPHINPQFAGKNGIDAAICYRLAVRQKQAREIDSADEVKAAYRLCFGNDIPPGADTILNAFMPFLEFCKARLIVLGYLQGSWEPQGIVLPLVQKHWNEVFSPEYDSLRVLFDTYFDRMYCFGNLMPAPFGLNGCRNRNGKGTWGLNKDHPSEYLKNLRDPGCNICREYRGCDILAWLEKVIPPYHLEGLYRLPPPYPPTGHLTADKHPALEKFIRQAITEIEARAEKIRRV